LIVLQLMQVMDVLEAQETKKPATKRVASQRRELALPALKSLKI
jgi:hypothetical protein